MRFKLLGPLEIAMDDESTVILSASKLGQVLGLLLIRSNEIVSVDSLLQELWGDEPPRSALTTLQTYVYHARRMFAREGFAATRTLLVTRPRGYLIEVEPDEVDAKVFERLIKQGRALLDESRTEEASDRLRTALDMWRGPALASISVGEVLQAHVAHLGELRIRAVELRIQAEKQLGRHRELIPELRSLVVAYPLNEWFHGQLINALYRAGRRAEALQAYQSLRRILKEELGVEPTAEIQRLQQEVLNPGPERRSRNHVNTRGDVNTFGDPAFGLAPRHSYEVRASAF
jgi:DNA-binding SARP family transcriptional activator